MNDLIINKFIEQALIEDIGLCDHSTFKIFENKTLKSNIKLKSDEAILCGIDIAEKVFLFLNQNLKIDKLKNDGDLIKKDDIILEIKGDAKSILLGERVALNLLSYLSGISTKAYKIKNFWLSLINLYEIIIDNLNYFLSSKEDFNFIKFINYLKLENKNKIEDINDNLKNFLYNNEIVDFIKEIIDLYKIKKQNINYLKNIKKILENIRIVDTRKILPLYRPFVKYAVRIGGLYNHRYNLSDGIMLKENHIKAFGSIKKAIKSLKENSPLLLKIECEVENFNEFLESYEGKADVIMLDEFSEEDYKKVADFLKTNNKNFLLEISGNIDYNKLISITKIIIKTGLNLDIISIGSNLTLNVNIADFSMKYI